MLWFDGTASPVKGLAQKHVDQSLIARTHINVLGMIAHAC